MEKDKDNQRETKDSIEHKLNAKTVKEYNQDKQNLTTTCMEAS